MNNFTIKKLEERIATLEQRVAELEAKQAVLGLVAKPFKPEDYQIMNDYARVITGNKHV